VNRTPPNAKKIKLTRGRFALVDAWRHKELNVNKWHFVATGKGSGYAGRHIAGSGNGTRALHHDVLGIDSKIHVDHKNRIGLDCRHENLRVANRSLNGANRDKFVGRPGRAFTSKYKGVVDRSKHGARAPWLARIRVNHKLIRVGTYRTEAEAAVAYDAAALHHFGEFACTNFAWETVR
jgi:hypothetical protein